MTEAQFNREYGRKGGMRKLMTLFNDGTTHVTIGRYYGVSRWAVSLWCREFFGGIDPRKLRRLKRLNTLYYELTLLGDEHQFNSKFALENRSYRQTVIKKYRKALEYAKNNRHDNCWSGNERVDGWSDTPEIKEGLHDPGTL